MAGNAIPDWATHAIYWHVYPLGFVGAPIWDQSERHSPTPRLAKLIDQLDYLTSLGLNGLLLGPVFASPTHGYDTTDYFRIDDRLGTNEDMDALISACQERGIKVLFDGVFSHADATFSHPEMLHQDEVFEGHGNLKRFDHSNPAVAEFVVDVMNHWLDKGIDGWRLDAAYSVGNDFWKPVLEKVKSAHPDAFIFGEVIHGDYASFIEDGGMDSVTQYELWKAIWSSLKDENFFELDWTLKRHNEFTESFIPQTFISNHDVTRITTQVGPEKARIAIVILLTLAGIPSIYYGDELGWEGLKEERHGGDDAIRPEFPAHADINEVTNLYKGLIHLRRENSWLVNATVEVTELENQKMSYTVTERGGDRKLFVSLDITGDKAQATITDPFGTVVFGF